MNNGAIAPENVCANCIHFLMKKAYQPMLEEPECEFCGYIGYFEDTEHTFDKWEPSF